MSDFASAGLYSRELADAAIRLELDVHELEKTARRGFGNVSDGLGEVAWQLSHLGTTISADLQVIAEALRSTTSHLAQLVDLLAHPSTARSNELRARGLHALANNWREDAVRDLSAAVAENPYDFLSYFGLGQLALSENDATNGAQFFALAAKYAGPTAPAVAAGAALIGATAFDARSESAAAVRLLRETASMVPTCAEVLLGLAIRTREQVALERALSLDPFLIVDAEAAELEHLVPVSEKLSTTQLELRARTLEGATQSVHKELTASGATIRTSPERPLSAVTPQRRFAAFAMYNSRLVDWLQDAFYLGESRAQQLASLSAASVAIPARSNPPSGDSRFLWGAATFLSLAVSAALVLVVVADGIPVAALVFNVLILSLPNWYLTDKWRSAASAFRANSDQYDQHEKHRQRCIDEREAIVLATQQRERALIATKTAGNALAITSVPPRVRPLLEPTIRT